MPGQGLDELLPLAPDRATAILAALCRALAHIHRAGFVHCDLKPENIRVGEDGMVKLMDFGLMEVAGQSGGPIKGTLAYMAPEVAKRDRIDQRSDLYSLGAVAHHLLTGRPPFGGDDAIALLKAHLTETPPSAHRLNPEVPLALSQTVERLLAKEPLARFQSAEDVLAALGLEPDAGREAALLASAFVGREAELARLVSAIQALQAEGQGGTRWITGPAGAGKSRLLGELRFAGQLLEMPFLQGACGEPPTPYGPFTQILRGLLPLAEERCPALLFAHRPLLAKIMPELSDGRPAPAIEPDTEKVMLQSAFAALILGATAGTGAVLAIEDHHAIDPLSAEALKYLLRNAEGAPLLVVLTSREEAGEEAIALGGLSPHAVQHMARGMLGVEALSAAFVQPLYELTAGLPARVSQVLEHLVRRGAIAMQAGRFVVPETFPSHEVPEDLQAMLLQQLEALSPGARQLAELAAAHRAPFPLALASEVLQLPDEALFDALDELLAARVLDSAGDRYAFASPELAQALYQALAAPEGLHGAIARALEGRLPENPPLAELSALARHCLAARLPEAVRYAYQAAVAHQAIYAIETAQALLEGGLALLEAHPETSWDPLRCDYRAALAETLIGRHALDQTARHLEAGLALATSLGDETRRLRLMLAAGSFAIESQAAAKLKEGVATFEEARALAASLGDEARQVLAGFKQGRCQFFLGQNARAVETLEAVAALPFAPDHPYWYARTVGFLGYLRASASEAGREAGLSGLREAQALQEAMGEKIGLSMTCNLLSDLELRFGDFAEAERTAEQEAALMLEIGHMGAYAVALLNRAIASLELGRFDAAIRHGEASIALGRKIDDKVSQCLSSLVVGLARLQRGQAASGLEHLQAGQAAASETASYIQALALPYVVEGQLLLGRLAAAKTMAQEAQFMLRSCEDPGVHLRMQGLLAQIHGGLGELEMARGFAEAAMKDALAAGAKGEVVKALMIKARLALAAEAPEEAEKLALQGFSRAQALGAPHLAARLKGLLGEAALAQGLPEALSHFREMQALADQAGAPLLRAEARFGQALANPGDQSANQLILEAQQGLRAVAEELGDEGREAFYQP
ncbi:MAG: protein kinase domain-containing protein, partial [Candidatus Sericytochromatia bacterium]